MSRQPQSPDDAIEKVTSLLLAGKVKAALAAAREAAKRFAHDSSVVTRLADAFYANADLPNAEKQYRRAI